MSLFDRLVSEALRSQTELSPLRTVVEKELLHHDILREMSTAGLLEGLTFIGGTCLRACYGSNRLSEDPNKVGHLTYFATLKPPRVGTPFLPTLAIDTWTQYRALRNVAESIVSYSFGCGASTPSLPCGAWEREKSKKTMMVPLGCGGC